MTLASATGAPATAGEVGRPATSTGLPPAGTASPPSANPVSMGLGDAAGQPLGTAPASGTSPALPLGPPPTVSAGAGRAAATDPALDALQATRLELVRRKPVPFPPEPLRYPIVQATRGALAREDATGRRGTYLRLLDRFGVGFNS